MLYCHFKKSVNMLDEKEYLVLIKKKNTSEVKLFPHWVIDNLFFFCTIPIPTLLQLLLGFSNFSY